MLGKTTCTFLMGQIGWCERWSWETPALPKIHIFSDIKYLHSAWVSWCCWLLCHQAGTLTILPQNIGEGGGTKGKKWHSFRVINATMLTSNKYVGCCHDTARQDPTHLYNHSTQICLYFNHLTLLHHVSCALKWLIWFHAEIFWFDSLMMPLCWQKHVAIFSVI